MDTCINHDPKKTNQYMLPTFYNIKIGAKHLWNNLLPVFLTTEHFLLPSIGDDKIIQSQTTMKRVNRPIKLSILCLHMLEH